MGWSSSSKGMLGDQVMVLNHSRKKRMNQISNSSAESKAFDQKLLLRSNTGLSPDKLCLLPSQLFDNAMTCLPTFV